jgi:peptide/nickel transport system substrate-binding protein
MTDKFPAMDYGQHLVEEVRAQRMTRRDLLRRASVLGLSAPFAGVLLEACGSSPAPASAPAQAAGASTGKPKRGGTLRVAASAPVAAVNPVTMYDSGSINIVQQVAEYLIWVNPDNTLRPVLATSWKPNSNASVWTVAIRQGVTFHDGSTLTADDVVATFERLVNPNSNSSALTNFKGVLAPGGIKKSGTYEVTFHLQAPFVDFPYTLASTNYNAVVLPKNFDGNFAKNPVGTGPFVLKSYQTQDSATFVRNPHYWQAGLPYLDGSVFTFFSTDSAEAIGLQNSTVDLLPSQPAAGSPLYTDPSVAILSVPSTAYDELFFRTDLPPFNDKRVRQALAYSLQREAIIQNLFQGRAQVGNDEVWAPGFPNSPSIPQRKYDPAKARALLKQAGHESGLVATLTTEQAGSIPQYATLVQAAAQAIGMTIKLDVESQSTFYGSGSNQPWLVVPLGIVDWAARATAQQFFGSAFLTGGVWNSAHWSDPTFDKLTTQYETTVDEQSRASLAKQAALIQQDETPAIIAYWTNGIFAASKKVHGVTPNGSEFVDLTSAWLD